MWFCMRISRCLEESVPNGLDMSWWFLGDFSRHAWLPMQMWPMFDFTRACPTYVGTEQAYFGIPCQTVELRLCASWKGWPLWSMQWAIPAPSSKRLKHWASGTWTSKLPVSWSKYVQISQSTSKHIKALMSYWNSSMALRPWQVSLSAFFGPFPNPQTSKVSGLAFSENLWWIPLMTNLLGKFRC